jgi:hypothetical protein
MIIRRNNPGNIRKDARWQWQGERIGTNAGDFITFDTLENGYRAMMKDLITKIKSGNDTIRKIIYKYAPSSDNNPTESYIRFVANSSGIDADTVLVATNPKQIGDVAYSMSLFEHGTSDQDGTLQKSLIMARNILFGIVQAVKENPLKTAILVAVIGTMIYLYLQK